MPENDVSYEVGYGKPPQSGQFPKGRSGNPKGRPKGSKNLATIMLQEARQTVRVNGPNGSRKVSKLQAAAMQLSTKAAQGDHRASRDFFNLVERSELAANAGSTPKSLPETDQAVMKMILRRLSDVQPEPAEPGTDEGENSK
jgi:predicted Zn-dependent peptidase